jgi:hypothetical protein
MAQRSSVTRPESRHNTRRLLSLLAIGLAAAMSLIPSAAEAQGSRTRRPAGRVGVACGGDALDGLCPSRCSADPAHPGFDADCFSCDALPSPEPTTACKNRQQPCEIHEGVNRMGAMFESGEYDDAAMRDVILAYWDGGYWELPVSWGAHGLDGFVVYAIVRTAMKYHEEMESHPTTGMALECMLRDHADRGLPTTVRNGERWFHGGAEEWNSWSEDYMGFAMGYASADAWFASSWSRGEYFDEYYQKVEDAVDIAFSISDQNPHTLRYEPDVDSEDLTGVPSVMMRNHVKYSPVYGMAVIKHLLDVNDVYRAAALPPMYTCSNKPESYDGLFEWVTSKIEPNRNGAGYVFRSGACLRSDGVMSHCDDRPADPPGSGGAQREPGHYPLQQSLPELCVSEHLEYFGPPCDRFGPAGIEQVDHNYYFNCVFAGADGR